MVKIINLFLEEFPSYYKLKINEKEIETEIIENRTLKFKYFKLLTINCETLEYIKNI